MRLTSTAKVVGIYSYLRKTIKCLRKEFSSFDIFKDTKSFTLLVSFCPEAR